MPLNQPQKDGDIPMAQYPANYKWLLDKYGTVMKMHQELGRAVREAGPIDEKNAQLVQLAAAAAMRAEGSVHSHAKRAMAAGASPEEVCHAIVLLTSTIGFPAVAAALSW